MRVLKFGGTSVANYQRVLSVADIAEKKTFSGRSCIGAFRTGKNYQSFSGDD